MNDEKNSSLSDNQLHGLLSKPEIPSTLQTKLQKNFSEQINAEQTNASHRRWRKGLALSVAANVIFAVLILSPYSTMKPSALMDMAYAHVQHEEELTGDFVTDKTAWLTAKNINPPPKAFTVGLAKNCLIGLDQAKHIRINTPQQNDINLLIFSQLDDELRPARDKGKKGLQQWITLAPRDGVYVIAFYESGVSNSEVKQLVRNMFQQTTDLSSSQQHDMVI